MDRTEQTALTNWLITTMAEEIGLAAVEVDPLPGSDYGDYIETNVGYTETDFDAVLTKHLGEELTQKLQRLYERTDSFWEAWPFLDDSELGTIMLAGADKFL